MLRFLRLPTRVPVQLPDRQTSQKWLAAAVIAVLATVIAVAWRNTAFISKPMGLLDDLLYDSMYALRPMEDRKNGEIVIVAIGQADLDRLNQPVLKERKWPWPWPREFYGLMLQYLERCGAKLVVFDMLFSETSVHQFHGGDDDNFAEMVNGLKMPVVFGTVVKDGQPGHFEPPVEHPVLGGVNTPPTTVLRKYRPTIDGYPSLAYRAVEKVYGAPPVRTEPFLTHYYGPYVAADGRRTHRYIPASDVVFKSFDPQAGVDLRPETFRDKIVVIGGIAANLQDDKATPVSQQYPGVEWQATAIQNLLHYQRVIVVPNLPVVGLTLISTFLAAGGTLIPRKVWLKLTAAAVVMAGVILIAVLLFRRPEIRYLPLAVPVVAMLLATLGAFAWSYFTEDRQRQFVSKAFALSTSPIIAEAISKNPEKLKLGGERREITVMFTDLAGFTDLSETMEVVKLAQVINTYMEAMSEEIVARDGYLDKYIGDAIMSFWNGLVDQPDHAARACRAALGIKRRELEIAPELQKLVEAKIVTRIGVNTGPMAVGNLGSSRKLSYTVLGDAVNLGARLEPANKLYDTEVIISQTTADQVKGQFVIRELDLLAVKGKTIPMAVYELMGETGQNGDVLPRVQQYAEGLAHYRAQRWDDAERVWTRLLKDFPTDGPSAKMLARVAKLRHEPLPADWDGVYRSKEK